MKNCPKCNTALMSAPGIGSYCPNWTCEVVDGLWGGARVVHTSDALQAARERVVAAAKTWAKVNIKNGRALQDREDALLDAVRGLLELESHD